MMYSTPARRGNRGNASENENGLRKTRKPPKMASDER